MYVINLDGGQIYISVCHFYKKLPTSTNQYYASQKCRKPEPNIDNLAVMQSKPHPYHGSTPNQSLHNFAANVNSSSVSYPVLATKTLQRQLGIFRISMFVLLALLVAVAGSTTYFLLRMTQENDFNRMYDSSVVHISTSVDINLRAMLGSVNVVNNIFAYAIENGYVGNLPNITLPGFERIMTGLGDLVGSRTIAYVPILTNQTRRGWEAYAAANVDLLNGPDSLKISRNGSWTVKDGIFAVGKTGLEYSPGYVKESTYPHIVTPIWQIAPMAAPAVMLDIHHYSKDETDVIDRVISSKTGGFTDLIQLVEDVELRPSSLLISPVTTVTDNTVVGLIDLAFSWDTILQHALPSSISGITCVVMTSTQSYTYHIKDGVVKLLGPGDQHDTKYNKNKKVITASLTTLTSITASDYHFIIHPTDELVKKYINKTPGIVCGSMVAFTLFIALVIYLYDRFRRAREMKLQGTVESTTKITTMTLNELEAKKDFIRYISHEVRTPLNTLKMGLHVLEQDFHRNSPTKDIFATIQDIQTSCDTALEVVNDFLLFDKIITHSLVLDLGRINICEFIEESLKPFYVQARQLDISLVLINELSGEDNNGLRNIHADKLRLSQVVRNLISNALKFTPQYGEITVRVKKCKDVAKQPGYFIIEIQDTGIGMSREKQESLFQDVIQFGASSSQGGKGSGLGLFISQGIIKKHGGDIKVFSRGEGKGSTFTVRIPVNKETPGKSMVLDYFSNKKGISKSNRSAYTGYTLEKRTEGDETGDRNVELMSHHNIIANRDSYEVGSYKRPSLPQFDAMDSPVGQEVIDTTSADISVINILVVDDNISNRKMLCRMLTKCSSKYKCDESLDGLAAIERVKKDIDMSVASLEDNLLDIMSAAKSKKYDVIFMDSLMPTMNGMEAVQVLRDLDYSGLIIGVIGHSEEFEKDLFLANGANYVLSKPLEPAIVIDIINDYFEEMGKGQSGSEKTDS